MYLPNLSVIHDQNAPVDEVDVLLGYTVWGGSPRVDIYNYQVVVYLPILWVNYDQNAPVDEVDAHLGYTP